MVERLVQQYILRHMLEWPGFFQATRTMLAAYTAFTPADHKVLADYTAQLRTYLTRDHDDRGSQPLVNWRDRIAGFQAQLSSEDLVAVACLYPAAIAPIMRNQPSRPLLSALSHTSRSFNEEKQRRAAEWIAWALDLLEAASLLSTAQYQRLFGESVPAEPMVALRVIADALGNIPPPPRLPGQAFGGLTPRQGRELGDYAVRILVQGTVAALDISGELLLDVACLVPDSLQGLHEKLAAFPHLYRQGRGAIFFRAPAPVADLLRQHTTDADGFLKALVWTTDPSVPPELHEMRRRHQRLPGLFIEPYQYTFEAGWELTAEGTRRELCYDTAYELIDFQESSPGSRRPLNVATPSEESCGLCGHRLANLLELDLTDPRFSFLHLPGRYLVVPTCPTCWGWTFVRTDAKGNATWLPDSSREIEDVGERVTWPRNSLDLGPAARTPIQGLARGGSYLGGHPEWINDAEFPSCPSCRQTMMLLAHVSLDRLGGDGIIYAFLCRDCRTTATASRCT